MFFKRLQSFRFAFNGIRSFLRSEPNGRIHFVATIAVIIAGIWLHCTQMEWIVLIIVMAMVWLTEMLNTAIEKIMDHITPEQHPGVKRIKDIAAGAVLIAAIAAAITGALIFLPKIS
ncbi:diacylglycerol kinase [Chitinophaga sp. SYP-B3965]|uniref:diacylglycerol kinase family protein n=1 Tax=Chitinophaga sp. SYP-B3965 TaxID=2663120 RepID=UPI001299E57C|nr:diacylglycerol kinase family protein [Chitinophaga sp. SYP-B3965]MRG49060.1 diacylglycerol kinase [Chitinophaga sp. SYP-B3965]